MKYQLNIQSIKTVDEVEQYWSATDYLELLERFDFSDADATTKKEELRELLFLAITDFEPNEAAAILLDYKLNDQLSEGQISQLSHEMIEDKVSEEYADIALHAVLFHINQLLYKAYNGKFPHAKANIISFAIQQIKGEKVELTKEIVLKALAVGLSDHCVLHRLYPEQIKGEAEFLEAENILWDFTSENGQCQLLTSEYWLDREDFVSLEFEADVMQFVLEEED